MTFVDISNGKLIHACSEFIKTISRYFGRNFWKLKVKFSVKYIKKLFIRIDQTTLCCSQFADTSR
jgi:hypothetical protein